MDGIFQYDTEVWNYWNLSTLWWGARFELMLRLFTMWSAQEELLSTYLFGYPVGCFRSRLTKGIFQLWSLDYYLHVMYVLTYIYIYIWIPLSDKNDIVLFSTSLSTCMTLKFLTHYTGIIISSPYQQFLPSSTWLAQAGKSKCQALAPPFTVSSSSGRITYDPSVKHYLNWFDGTVSVDVRWVGKSSTQI